VFWNKKRRKYMQLHYCFVLLGVCTRSTSNTKSIYSTDVLLSGCSVLLSISDEGQRTSDIGTFLPGVKVPLSYLQHTLRDSTALPFSFNRHKIHWPTFIEFLLLHFLFDAVKLTYRCFLHDLFILKFCFIEMLNIACTLSQINN